MAEHVRPAFANELMELQCRVIADLHRFDVRLDPFRYPDKKKTGGTGLGTLAHGDYF